MNRTIDEAEDDQPLADVRGRKTTGQAAPFFEELEVTHGENN
jgi:hypothetical protein